MNKVKQFFKTGICLSYGPSMLQALPKICIVMIKPYDTYCIGDIVSLKTLDGMYHNHRIVKIDDFIVSTKGDNLEQQWYEQDVPVRNIKGKVKLILPLLR